jgi:uncharacterized protein with FMN-binding domain
MHRGLVALSASAVAAIYMAGYLRTQAADASIAAAAVPTATLGQGAPIAAAAPTATPPQPIVLRQPPTVARAAPPAPPQTQPQPTPAAVASGPGTGGSGASSQTQSAALYRDGTYTGQGTSRRGDLTVSLQVQGGRITSVTITRSTLQYPLRDIADLPAEVVQRQSAQVDIVSRATYSSMAFRGAVSQALTAAHNA